MRELQNKATRTVRDDGMLMSLCVLHGWDTDVSVCTTWAVVQLSFSSLKSGGGRDYLFMRSRNLYVPKFCSKLGNLQKLVKLNCAYAVGLLARC